MQMIWGWPYRISSIKGSDAVLLSLLINDPINNCHSSVIPVYVHNLFQNIVHKIKKVELNICWMNQHKEYAQWTQFGYKKLKPLFYVEECINFMKLCRLFSKDLEQIVVM